MSFQVITVGEFKRLLGELIIDQAFGAVESLSDQFCIHFDVDGGSRAHNRENDDLGHAMSRSSAEDLK
ncbi:hypothetical protein AAHE18_02G133000 [Arachis hypogaea]